MTFIEGRCIHACHRQAVCDYLRACFRKESAVDVCSFIGEEYLVVLIQFFTDYLIRIFHSEAFLVADYVKAEGDADGEAVYFVFGRSGIERCGIVYSYLVVMQDFPGSCIP